MSNSRYFKPKSVAEAVFLLSEHRGKAEIIAGGTDLLLKMKGGVIQPDFFISLSDISELDYIDYDEINGLRIGALTTIGSIAKSMVIQSQFSILAQAAGMLGTPSVRNQATLGGNLCNAAPSADTAPALMALGARVKIVGVEGEKVVPIEDFFTGPGETIINHGQLLTEIQIPNLALGSSATYIKHTRREGADLAVVGVAALVTIDSEILANVKIALGAVAPTPIRAKRAEGILIGKRLDDELLEEAGQAASHASSPIDDCRSCADYRFTLVPVLVKRAVKQAVEQVLLEV